MSQSDLARTLGITFQQVQKYERGSNRVSVGKLFRLAEILDVPLTFFFDGLNMPQAGRTEMVDGDGQSPMLSRRELDVLRAWKSAPPPIADAVASLLRSVNPDAVPDFEDLEEETTHRSPAATPARETETATPKRRGRPPKSAQAASATGAGTRRRRNAVWDPSDIERAAREKS